MRPASGRRRFSTTSLGSPTAAASSNTRCCPCRAPSTAIAWTTWRAGSSWCAANRALTSVCATLAHLYLDFVLSALDPPARVTTGWPSTGSGATTRRSAIGGVGRVWALGVAAVHAQTAGMRARALVGFRIAAEQRSPHVRTMVFAALGAAEVLAARSDEPAARALLARRCPHDRAAVGRPERGLGREPRLTYGNGCGRRSTDRRRRRTRRRPGLRHADWSYSNSCLSVETTTGTCR